MSDAGCDGKTVLEVISFCVFIFAVMVYIISKFLTCYLKVNRRKRTLSFGVGDSAPPSSPSTSTTPPSSPERDEAAPELTGIVVVSEATRLV